MTQPRQSVPSPLGYPCWFEWHRALPERRRVWCESCKRDGCQCPNHKKEWTK